MNPAAADANEGVCAISCVSKGSRASNGRELSAWERVNVAIESSLGWNAMGFGVGGEDQTDRR